MLYLCIVAVCLKQEVCSQCHPVSQGHLSSGYEQHGVSVDHPRMGNCVLVDACMCCLVTLWTPLPRLETRTKKAHMCVSSWVAKVYVCAVTMLVGQVSSAIGYLTMKV